MTSTTMPVLCADRLQTGCACMFIYFKIQRISVKNGDVYMIPGPGPQPIRVIIIKFFVFLFFLRLFLLIGCPSARPRAANALGLYQNWSGVELCGSHALSSPKYSSSQGYRDPLHHHWTDEWQGSRKTGWKQKPVQGDIRSVLFWSMDQANLMVSKDQKFQYIALSSSWSTVNMLCMKEMARRRTLESPHWRVHINRYSSAMLDTSAKRKHC